MNGHLALVIDQPGTTLTQGTHDTLVVTYTEGRRERVGLRALGAVVLHGDIQLTTGVLHALAAHGIDCTALPTRQSTPAVRLTHPPHRFAQLRHQQHRLIADPTRRLELARWVVWAKLDAMAEFARQHQPDSVDTYYQAMHSAALANDVAALMGVEGAATRKHFAILGTLYQQHSTHFRFPERSRQPPRDPVNALMSLTYTLAQGQATQQVLRAGLDLPLGFLHQAHRDRDALALDLLEPARAVIDDWVFGLLTRDARLTPAMFTQAKDGGVWLTKEGRARFYPAWFRDGHRLTLPPMRRLLAKLLEQLRATTPNATAADQAT